MFVFVRLEAAVFSFRMSRIRIDVEIEKEAGEMGLGNNPGVKLG